MDDKNKRIQKLYREKKELKKDAVKNTLYILLFFALIITLYSCFDGFDLSK